MIDRKRRLRSCDRRENYPPSLRKVRELVASYEMHGPKLQPFCRMEGRKYDLFSTTEAGCGTPAWNGGEIVREL